MIISTDTAMLLGTMVALLYVLTVFGQGHKPGQPPRRGAWTVGPVCNGSLYLLGMHVHHWVIAWALWPMALCYGLPEVSWFLFWVGLHGFSYPDALCLN